MKFIKAKSRAFLLIGIIAGLLAGGGYLFADSIQSQVGIAARNTSSVWKYLTNVTVGTSTSAIVAGEATQDVAGQTWKAVPSVPIKTTDLTGVFGGTIQNVGTTNMNTPIVRSILTVTDSQLDSYTRLSNVNTTSISTGVGNTLAVQPTIRVGDTGSGGNSWTFPLNDGVTQATAGIGSVGAYLFNGAAFDKQRSVSGGVAGTGGTGVASVGNLMLRGDTGTFVFPKLAEANSLTATTTGAVQAFANYTAWTVSSGPAAGTQASASKASGGGTVRHVATSISACYSDTAVAVARHVNLRDGASGAGTILARWMLAIPAANDSHCVTLSGFSIIGTAATAMTLEFDAAGAATSEQTVNLTGYSVP